MTEIEIAQAVTTAFYSVLVNEEGLALVNDNYDRLDSLLRETRLMFENGFAEKIDVNRVQVEFNNTKTSFSRKFVIFLEIPIIFKFVSDIFQC